MGDLSPHFSAREFNDPHGHHGTVSADLIAALERLRSICNDRPLRIVSGYRCPSHNRSVGGARASQHLYGRAADIPSGYATVAQAEAAGFKGIGTKGQWVTHVDVRPGRRARWYY